MASIIKDKLHRCFCGHIRSREERKEAERQLATIMEIITPFLEQCVETGDGESWEEFKYWFPLFLKASSLREHGYTAECIGEGRQARLVIDGGRAAVPRRKKANGQGS